jgi:hypothetical protein
MLPIAQESVLEKYRIVLLEKLFGSCIYDTSVC